MLRYSHQNVTAFLLHSHPVMRVTNAIWY